MTAIKTIVESNQTFIDKVIQENEDILNQIADLKQQISQTKLQINKIRTETKNSVQPKIAELKKQQNEEFQAMKNSYENKISLTRNKQKEEFNQIKLNCDKEIQEAELKCQRQIKKMQLTGANREKELTEAINQKLSQIPDKFSRAKEKVAAEEKQFRQEWEKIIYEKLKKESQEQLKADQSLNQSQHEQRIIEIVSDIEQQTRDEKQILESKIIQEKQEHQILVTKLNQNIDNLNAEIENLQSSSESSQIDIEIKALKEKIEQCQCKQYKEQLKEINFQIAECEDEISMIQKSDSSKRLQYLNELGSYKEVLQAEISASDTYKKQKRKCQSELEQIQLNTQQKLKQMEEEHKKQISVIGERVKQTVQKKDDVIKELKEKLSKFKL